MPEGVIVKGVGGLYYARDAHGNVHVLRAKGKFRKQRVTPMVMRSPAPPGCTCPATRGRAF